MVNLVESKGLDEQRQNHLICSIQEKANELSSSLMLVALCEVIGSNHCSSDVVVLQIKHSWTNFLDS